MAASQAIPISDRRVALISVESLSRIFSFPVFLAALLAAGVFLCARLNPPDPDTWWHIAAGEQILRTGAWPTVDPYSYTAAQTAWTAYEWLGEVVMAFFQSRGGPVGRTLLLIVLSVGVYWLLLYYCWLRSGNVKSAFSACAVLLPLAAFFFTLRPQLIGYGFLLLTLICLKRFRQGRQKSLWILPPLFLVWVNTHGSFAFGMFAFALYWMSGLVDFRFHNLIAERWTPGQRRHLAVVFLLCLIALTATPYGTYLAAYPMEMALFQPANIASIREWQPLGTDILMGKVFVGMLLVFFVLNMLWTPTYRVEELGLLLFAVYAASVHRRFLFLLLIVIAPFFALILSRWWAPYKRSKDRPLLNAFAVALVIVGMVAFFPTPGAVASVVERNYPVRAMEYLRAHPVEGPLLNEYGWGGYIIWATGGTHKVFIDGRADIYEYSGVLPDYMDITLLKPNALDLMRKYGIRACLLQHDAPLATVLGALPEWERVYADDVSVLFVRRNASSGD